MMDLRFNRFAIYIFIFFIPGIVFCQEAFLSKKVNIKAVDATLEQILEQITRQTGINFSYNSELLIRKGKSIST